MPTRVSLTTQIGFKIPSFQWLRCSPSRLKMGGKLPTISRHKDEVCLAIMRLIAVQDVPRSNLSQVTITNWFQIFSSNLNITDTVSTLDEVGNFPVPHLKGGMKSGRILQ
jgi:hypothetical protein